MHPPIQASICLTQLNMARMKNEAFLNKVQGSKCRVVTEMYNERFTKQAQQTKLIKLYQFDTACILNNRYIINLIHSVSKQYRAQKSTFCYEWVPWQR